MSNVVIVDYGLGNLFNVARAVEACGGVPELSGDPAVLLAAERAILPGVGAFELGMRGLEERQLVEPLRRFAASGRPLLGICLGMQLLFDESEEHGLHRGLSIVSGRVVRLPESATGGHTVPQIGWNALRAPAGRSWAGSLLEPLEQGASMYFLHSYCAVPTQSEHVAAETEYGGRTFCSVVQAGQTVGIQPHPERSAQTGLALIRRFLS